MATELDAASIRDVYAPYCEHTPITFEEVTPSLEEMRQRIRKVTAQYPWLVCECDGVVMGYAYGSQHRERAAYRWSVEVGVYVAEGRQRSGLGGALYTALLHLLAQQGYHRAFGGITLPNPASVGLHEALGFKPVGIYHGIGYKSGAWRDVGWWELALSASDGKPAEPVSVQVILDTEGWRQAIAAGERRLRN